MDRRKKEKERERKRLHRISSQTEHILHVSSCVNEVSCSTFLLPHSLSSWYWLTA